MESLPNRLGNRGFDFGNHRQWKHGHNGTDSLAPTSGSSLAWRGGTFPSPGNPNGFADCSRLTVIHLAGSCHCGAIRFSLDAPSPVPFMHCHCSICRKTAGSGGYAINLGGDFKSMRVSGRKNLGIYQAIIREAGKRPIRSEAKRHFCLRCGSPLWLWDPRWPDLVHPHASAIDTPLPKPPEVVEAGLDYAAAWVDVPTGHGHTHWGQWPAESLEEWHQRHGLWQGPE